ncbi:hypothetical protein K469DRAFT_154760 [Zopfia rhizophila CBS 207.26]|uniref:Uncharacterized protein n=1 Tax=Zopfia rhizophila CBS 207.26 TaxID=1314779 RepID=A0A6A6E750_9PEZI|nr:hypothetical protein K469DRAFT_154760 [Zopfia rhizophila CBS 207.26]
MSLATLHSLLTCSRPLHTSYPPIVDALQLIVFDCGPICRKPLRAPLLPPSRAARSYTLHSSITTGINFAVSRDRVHRTPETVSGTCTHASSLPADDHQRPCQLNHLRPKSVPRLIKQSKDPPATRYIRLA